MLCSTQMKLRRCSIPFSDDLWHCPVCARNIFQFISLIFGIGRSLLHIITCHHYCMLSHLPNRDLCSVFLVDMKILWDLKFYIWWECLSKTLILHLSLFFSRSFCLSLSHLLSLPISMHLPVDTKHSAAPGTFPGWSFPGELSWICGKKPHPCWARLCVSWQWNVQRDPEEWIGLRGKMSRKKIPKKKIPIENALLITPTSAEQSLNVLSLSGWCWLICVLGSFTS